MTKIKEKHCKNIASAKLNQPDHLWASLQNCCISDVPEKWAKKSQSMQRF